MHLEFSYLIAEPSATPASCTRVPIAHFLLLASIKRFETRRVSPGLVRTAWTGVCGSFFARRKPPETPNQTMKRIGGIPLKVSITMPPGYLQHFAFRQNTSSRRWFTHATMFLKLKCEWAFRGDGYCSPTCQPASINSDAKPLYCLSAFPPAGKRHNNWTPGRDVNPAAAISKHLPPEPGLAHILGLTWVSFPPQCVPSPGSRSGSSAAIHHQSPAPVGSTELLIGPRHALTPPVQPDVPLVGQTHAPWRLDRPLIGCLFPQQAQTDRWLVLRLASLEH